jgi:hypothetical protein
MPPPRAAAFALLATLAACAAPQSGASSSSSSGAAASRGVASPAMEDRACSRDSECALADDCCGCAQGGQRHAVRRDRVEALQSASESACGQRNCPGGAAHRSCEATAARCSGGLCVPAL